MVARGVRVGCATIGFNCAEPYSSTGSTQLGAQFVRTGTDICPNVDPRPTHAAAREPVVKDTWLPVA